MRRLRNQIRGASLSDYGIATGTIAVVAILAVQAMGQKVTELYELADVSVPLETMTYGIANAPELDWRVPSTYAQASQCTDADNCDIFYSEDTATYTLSASGKQGWAMLLTDPNYTPPAPVTGFGGGGEPAPDPVAPDFTAGPEGAVVVNDLTTYPQYYFTGTYTGEDVLVMQGLASSDAGFYDFGDGTHSSISDYVSGASIVFNDTLDYVYFPLDDVAMTYADILQWIADHSASAG